MFRNIICCDLIEDLFESIYLSYDLSTVVYKKSNV